MFIDSFLMPEPHRPPLVSSNTIDSLAIVTVVIVTYESAHCLDALAPLVLACPHVIFVDNASADGSAAKAKERFRHAHVIALENNIGFGAANNRALDSVLTPYAFLLNPDCEISVESLALMLEEAQRFPDAAVLAPQLVNRSGEPDLSYRWPSTKWASRGPVAIAPACVGFVCGAAMLFVIANMTGAARFDEKFFLYYEDDDLCLRLFALQRSIVLIPRVTAVHRSRGSVKGRSPMRSEYLRGYHHAQSKLRFAAKHVHQRHAERLYRRTLCLALISWPFRLLSFSPKRLARLTGRIVGLLRWRPDA
ncbi:MAG: N-acetylglucosaminyl-diphospho-decaprenol L-rhamnosyltransferase [Pseudomonadota bacterium]